ncbi:hypothetical protein BaRGS_00032142 [Batillaria attramentaria]|uniref:Uncharacterized protein n=1 Tax=Batillaria attramentaria TaxID=370345 RepID=A0ABD0JPF0_9CAEN
MEGHMAPAVPTAPPLPSWLDSLCSQIDAFSDVSLPQVFTPREQCPSEPVQSSSEMSGKRHRTHSDTWENKKDENTLPAGVPAANIHTWTSASVPQIRTLEKSVGGGLARRTTCSKNSVWDAIPSNSSSAHITQPWLSQVPGASVKEGTVPKQHFMTEKSPVGHDFREPQHTVKSATVVRGQETVLAAR